MKIEEEIMEAGLSKIPKEDRNFLEQYLAFEQGTLMDKVKSAIKEVIQIVRVERFEELEIRIRKLEELKKEVEK